jgi:hypothetical protein
LGLLIALGAGACFGAAALGYVTFLLWPRWPGPSARPDTPSLPITVGGVAFNVPPAAIRVPLQRRAGAQARLDLALLWPELTPPDPAAKPALSADPKPVDQLFVSIAGAEETLSLQERLKTIYPRYTEPNAFAGPEGLIGVAFRDGTPYQGEDLFFEAGRPEHFIVRCTRTLGMTEGSCLYERRLGAADLTVRFPRDWLKDWQRLAEGMEQLIILLRPAKNGAVDGSRRDQGAGASLSCSRSRSRIAISKMHERAFVFSSMNKTPTNSSPT